MWLPIVENKGPKQSTPLLDYIKRKKEDRRTAIQVNIFFHWFLPPVYEVLGKVIIRHTSVCPQVGGRWGWGGYHIWPLLEEGLPILDGGTYLGLVRYLPWTGEKVPVQAGWGRGYLPRLDGGTSLSGWMGVGYAPLRLDGSTPPPPPPPSGWIG